MSLFDKSDKEYTVEIVRIVIEPQALYHLGNFHFQNSLAILTPFSSTANNFEDMVLAVTKVGFKNSVFHLVLNVEHELPRNVLSSNLSLTMQINDTL